MGLEISAPLRAPRGRGCPKSSQGLSCGTASANGKMPLDQAALTFAHVFQGFCARSLHALVQRTRSKLLGQNCIFRKQDGWYDCGNLFWIGPSQGLGSSNSRLDLLHKMADEAKPPRE